MSFLITVFALSLPVQSTTLDGQNSLADNIKTLSAQPDKTPSDQFALGALYFLRGIEKTLQARWNYNAVIQGFDFPVLRLPLRPNPSPKPFKPSLITDIFAELRTDMQASRDAMAQIPADAELELNINLNQLWFDVNVNNQRDVGEGAVIIGVKSLMRPLQVPEIDEMPPMQVRFDTADRAWLTAYTHMLSAASEMVLAFDPTEAISRVMQARADIQKLLDNARPRSYWDQEFGNTVDQFAMVYGALNKKPDAIHTRAAHAHLLKMIAENKAFWAGIEVETDNRNEWIPNAKQTAALGYDMGPEVGDAWRAVLADGEALLKGELLIDYWRLSGVGGVNVKKMFMDPPAVDIVAWVQGYGLLPYLEKGKVITRANLRKFEQVAPGNPMLFSFLFN
ncbi:MAG: hypothetical protein CSA68_03935 [Rhodobacterales bacterium]|nr:MAG: hypothetical protein CSA68_03935 [Rhodobacterales bacterium]